MDNRCNHFDDCQDKSDEYMCRYIQLDKSRYRNRDIPFPSWHEKLKVEIGFDLQDIVDVNEPHVSLHIHIITACLKSKVFQNSLVFSRCHSLQSSMCGLSGGITDWVIIT